MATGGHLRHSSHVAVALKCRQSLHNLSMAGLDFFMGGNDKGPGDFSLGAWGSPTPQKATGQTPGNNTPDVSGAAEGFNPLRLYAKTLSRPAKRGSPEPRA